MSVAHTHTDRGRTIVARCRVLRGDVWLKRRGPETSCWWIERVLMAMETAQSGVSRPPVRRTSSIRMRLTPGTRAWRLNRSRSLISADFDDRRCVSGSASRCACSARAQSTCCGRRRRACLLCRVRGQYVVEQVDISSAIDRRTTAAPRDQYVSRITVAPTAISGLQVRASIVTGRREGGGCAR